MDALPARLFLRAGCNRGAAMLPEPEAGGMRMAGRAVASQGSVIGRERRSETLGAGEPRDGTAGSEPMRSRLFDADHPDEHIVGEAALQISPTDRQLLWIDVTGELTPEGARAVARHLGLLRRTRESLADRNRAPMLALQRDYLHIRIAADPSDQNPAQTVWLDLVAGRNVLLTLHERPIPFLQDVDDRIERDTQLGILSSAAFFAAIVDAAITSYHRAVDEIEDDVDRLDAESLRGTGRKELLGDLVRSRRRIAGLRRLLADHRSVFTALASPDVAAVVPDPEGAGLLQGLSARFEGAMGAVEDSREALLGSFDVFMSRTAQRTNDVMKILTIATVLLLPGSVIAGLLGMNVVVPLNADDPMSFWYVIGAFALLTLIVLATAKRRGWI